MIKMGDYMKKKLGLIFLPAAILALAGCQSSKLTTTKTTYQPTGLNAVVQGNASNDASLTYQVDNQAKQTVKVQSGSFNFQVPTTTKDQKITITALKNKQKTTKEVTVKAGQSIGNYHKIADSYNRALTYLALPTEIRDKISKIQPLNQSITTIPATPEQLKEAQTVQNAMSAAEKAQAKYYLPVTAKNGISELSKQKNYTIRANVQDNQLLGLTLITPVKVLKDKAAIQEFGTTFGLIAQATGADSKAVMKQFEKYTKSSQKSGQTTIKTIKSKGIKFDTGFSTDKLYLYITK